ncbi:hypothetical protein EVAR_18047_1 [Eumeta japonica]|uniref:Uncharacterized protein n=1 Tax=Eumeta variegata TaxID=151549 RepID=A0A4C1XXH8_EUMVA|nr:hypothetical protein EVAR_18047_1 [Eumeta japonica]
MGLRSDPTVERESKRIARLDGAETNCSIIEAVEPPTGGVCLREFVVQQLLCDVIGLVQVYVRNCSVLWSYEVITQCNAKTRQANTPIRV